MVLLVISFRQKMFHAFEMKYHGRIISYIYIYIYVVSDKFVATVSRMVKIFSSQRTFVDEVQFIIKENVTNHTGWVLYRVSNSFCAVLTMR